MAEGLTPAEETAADESEQTFSQGKKLAKELKGDGSYSSEGLESKREGTQELVKAVEAKVASLQRQVDAQERVVTQTEEEFKPHLETGRAKVEEYERKRAEIHDSRLGDAAYDELREQGKGLTRVEEETIGLAHAAERKLQELRRLLDQEQRELDSLRESHESWGRQARSVGIEAEANTAQTNQLMDAAQPELESAARKMMNNELEQRRANVLDQAARNYDARRQTEDEAKRKDEELRGEGSEFADRHQDVLEDEARKQMDADFAERNQQSE